MNQTVVSALIAAGSALAGSFITLLFAHLSASRAASFAAQREDLKHERQEMQRRREANEKRLEAMMVDLAIVADRLMALDFKNHSEFHFPDPSELAAAASRNIDSAALLFFPEMRAAAHKFHTTNVIVERAIIDQDQQTLTTAFGMWERDITLLRDAIAAQSAKYL